MKPSSILYNHLLRLTLFTRSNCALCDTAKAVLANVRAQRHVDYAEVDVMSAGRGRWKDPYEFDTPVLTPVKLHVEKYKDDRKTASTTEQARKLMHRFKEHEVQAVMDQVERDPGVAM
ncbi:hypothetical protein LTR62_001990 [Meristemomyces frigidus]|uniref:Glutaredoxin-like protein n=1 Tax=Meristemomyces frigidus TaxID=1508187 RepID=A0AAN7TJT8_9PEZI|nr:hypothetical protein LTR62_001990 [Meristemomyces frigidus]